MATAYSGEVAVGSYNRIRLRVEYSGTSASCHIEFRRTSTYSTTWGDTEASITFNGSTIAAPYWYTGSVDGTWREIASASGFSVPLSGGTFSWAFNNPLQNSVLGCSGTITIGEQASAPNTPTLSIGTVTKTSIGVSYGTSSFGYPTSGTVRLYGGTSASPSTQIASKTSTGQSTYTYSSLTGNTKYYFRSRASNSSLNSSYSSEKSAVTLSASPTVTAGDATSHSVVMNYTTEADGGFYNKVIQYSTDGGTTWQTGATVTGGSAQTGSFTIDNLPADTSTTVQIRTNTTSGSDSPVSIVVKTTQKDAKFYGPVRRYKITSSPTSKVSNDMFNGFTAEGFMQAYENKYGYMYGIPDYILVNHEAEDGSTTSDKCIWIYFKDGTRKFCDTVTASLTLDMNIWGMDFPGSEGSITANADKVVLNSIYYDGYLSKEVKRLYGPVVSLNSLTSSIVTTSGTMINTISDSNLANKIKSIPVAVSQIAEGKKVNGLRLEFNPSLGLSVLVIMLVIDNTIVYSETVPAGTPTWADCQTLASGWGITLNSEAPSGSRIDTVAITGAYNSTSKRIVKLYGSANGETALVFRDDES